MASVDKFCLKATSGNLGAGFVLKGVHCDGNDPQQKFRWTQEGKIKLIGFTDKDLCIGRVETNVVNPTIQVQACNPTGGNTGINLKWADSSGRYNPPPDPTPAPVTSAVPVVGGATISPTVAPLSFEEELKIRMEFLQNDAQRSCPEIAILRSLSHVKQDGSYSHVHGSCPTVDGMFHAGLAPVKYFQTNPITDPDSAHDVNIFLLHGLYIKRITIGEACEQETQALHQEIHGNITKVDEVSIWPFEDPDIDNTVHEFYDYGADLEYNNDYQELCEKGGGLYQEYAYESVCRKVQYTATADAMLGTVWSTVETVLATVSGQPKCISQRCKADIDTRPVFEKYAIRATEVENNGELDDQNTYSNGFYWICQGDPSKSNAQEAACLFESKALIDHLGLLQAEGAIEPSAKSKKFLWLLDTKDELVTFEDEAKVSKYESECSKAEGEFAVKDTMVICSSAASESKSYEITKMPMCRGASCGEEGGDAVILELFKKWMGPENIAEGVECAVSSGAFVNSFVVVALVGTLGAMVTNLM